MNRLRVIAALFLLLCICFSASAEQTYEYEPYDPLEFPAWAREVRRAEIIFFGSLPLSFGAASLVLPLFFEDDVPSSVRITTAVSLSAAVSLADFIIGRIVK